jgi:hypothetical protein
MTLTGDSAKDRVILDGTLERIAMLGSEQDKNAWRDRLVLVVAQSLIDARVVARAAGAPVTSTRELAKRMGLDLAAAAKALTTREGPLIALFADANQVARRGLAIGGGMAPSDSRKPAPGFEAKIVSEATGKLISASPSGEFKRGALTTDPKAVPHGKTTDGLLKDRNDALGRYDVLETELKQPGTTEARAEAIREEMIGLDTIINKATEDLGTEAGRAYARLHLDGFTDVPLPRTSAGVPDLVFQHPDGRIAIIECKGGDARLGTRLDTSGHILVQQGTIEYLRSLAATMAASEPGRVRDLGEQLQIMLESEQPNIEYHVVRQPIAEDGKLGSPQHGRFNLKTNERP